MPTLWTATLDEFLSATASAAPTPGGGSVAAVASAMGLGLILMALNVTAKKKQYPQEISRLISGGEELLSSLKAHADKDVEIFQRYSGALKLPKSTAAEATSRSMALEAAAVVATEAPLAAAATALLGMRLALAASDDVVPSIISDVACGAYTIGGGIQGMLMTVRANIPNIHNATLVVRFRDQANQISTESCGILDQIEQVVLHRLEV